MGILTPLGVPDFNGTSSKDYIKLKYTVSGQPADKVELELRKGSEIFFSATIEDAAMLSVGIHEYRWDGFDNHGVLDTAFLTSNKFNYLSRIYCKGKTKFKTIPFSGSYEKVNWVDVKIDKPLSRIDVTLRVNLIDGGSKGLKCSTRSVGRNSRLSKTVNDCPWDDIDQQAIINENKPPIKKRTKTFDELKEMVLDGINTYWSRRYTNTGGTIHKEKNWEVIVTAINEKDSEKSLDDIPLIYNTNNSWSRSGNTGGSYDDGNWDDEVMGLLPNGSVQRVSYNVGYILFDDWKDLNKNRQLYKQKGWRYYDEAIETEDFKETAAHEIGHEILQAFGGTVYSWQHKGSSYYLPQDEKPLGNESFKEEYINIDFMEETKGEKYPKKGEEVDLMKYYHQNKDIKSRIVANAKDVLGLVWLSKVNLK